ncbi:DHA2 family efflux MFS transporter permease subunit [Nocardia sp. 004]|uniref:DHA2 family efflux MFS transporter permease subunit n=1 Tax=Nocardia sp. 004 TaxID=3385978 RepID=UPI00399FAD62
MNPVKSERQPQGIWTKANASIIVATALGPFMVFLDTLVANVALPEIQADFGVGEDGLEWLVAAFSIGMAVSIMAWATVADRFGRRLVYMVSTGVFAVSSAAVGMAPDAVTMTIARAVQGVAGAAVIVAALALVSAAFPDSDERAKAIGLWTGVSTVALALGPTVGGILTESMGWRSAFLVNVPISLLVLVLAFKYVAESREERFPGFDWGGQILFVIAIGALIYGVIEGPKAGWSSPLVVTPLAVGAATLAAFAWYEYRHPDPMMDVHLFGNATYTLAIITILTGLFGVYGMLFVLTQHFQNVESYSPVRAGMLLLPYAITIALLSPIAGRLAARFGSLPIARIGQTLLAAALAVVAVGMAISLHVIVVGLFLVGVAISLVLTPVTALAMGAVPVDKSGMSSGMLNAQRGIGSAFGYAVLGSILAFWLSGTLEDELRTVVTEPTARQEIAERIINEATPYAYRAEIGPGRPLPELMPGQREAIIAVARDDFIRGSQVGLAAASTICVISAVMLWRHRSSESR